jgi:hypothetical protein
VSVPDPKALAKKILAQVESQPESLYMGLWEEFDNHFRVDWKNNPDEIAPGCGTTRCIAGWAVHFASNPGEGAWETRVRLADELDLAGPSWMRVGARLLGLDEHDADALFLQYGEAEAVEALRKLAADE